MYLFIEPLDVLLFRDSRPFAAGETHRAKQQFPPLPTALQGAIRTAILARAGVDLSRPFDDQAQVFGLVGNSASNYGCLRIRGPFLARRKDNPQDVEVLFPAPMNALVRKSTDGSDSISFLYPRQDEQSKLPEGWAVNGFDEFRPLKSAESGSAEAAQGYWLTIDGLIGLLKGGAPSGSSVVVRKAEIFGEEYRFGIELDHSKRTAASGKLYAAEFVRMRENFGFVVEVGLDGDSGDGELEKYLDSKGILALGGERRAASYEKVEAGQLDGYKLVTNFNDRDKGFFLYLATPAIFRPNGPGSPGWLPSWIDEKNLTSTCGSAKYKVIAAAVGKPVPISGWDMRKRRPKPLLRAVPAGSVYFCELTEGNMQAIVQGLHNQTISEFGKEIGMGLTFVGRWNYV